MRVMGQRLCVADAEVTGAGFERVAKSERAQCRVTARAAAGDNQTIAVDFAAVRKVTRAICAIVYVNDAPLLIEPFAILPSVTGAAAVIDVEHRKSAAGPILN